jgi:hypothetical protein
VSHSLSPGIGFGMLCVYAAVAPGRGRWRCPPRRVTEPAGGGQ